MTKITDINYQPLLAIKGRSDSTGMSFKDSLHGKTLVAWAALVVGILLSVLLLVISQGLAIVALGLMVLSFLPIGITMTLAMRAEDKKAWLQFAAVNNWPAGPALSSEQQLPPGMTTHTGVAMPENLVNLPVVTATIDAVTCDLFNGWVPAVGGFSVGHSGRQGGTYCLVAHSTLPKALPFMVLRATTGAIPDISPNAGSVATEALQLGDDFDHYFKLSVESGQQAIATQVLTPVIRQSLVQLTRTTPLQVVISGTDIYLINNNLIHAMTLKQVEQLLLATAAVTGEISSVA